MTKSRSFIITDWNLSLEFYDILSKTSSVAVRYIVVGYDKGENGNGQTEGVHFHAWIYYENPRELRTVLKQLAPRHVEITQGKTNQVYEYVVKKDLNPNGPIFEFGERPQQGKRTDLHEAARKVLSGERTPDSYLNEEEANIYHQYGRTLEKMYNLKLSEQHRDWETKILWITGPTGVGKSRAVYKNYNDEDYYIWEYHKSGWQDGYKGQKIVIMEDFRGEVKYQDLLRLGDRYPMKLPVRYKEPVPFLSTLIIITSSMTPEDIYGKEDNLDQLTRRLYERNIVDLTLLESFWSFWNVTVEEALLDLVDRAKMEALGGNSTQVGRVILEPASQE